MEKETPADNCVDVGEKDVVGMEDRRRVVRMKKGFITYGGEDRLLESRRGREEGEERGGDGW